MSFDQLPAKIEEGVQRYAEDKHISHDEAVIKLIETGLSTFQRGREPAATIPGLPEEPLSDEDAELIDSVVAEALEARRRLWERRLSA